LAAYLAAEGIRDLTDQARPEHSILGIAVTTAALIIMPGSAIAKSRTGRRMRNRAQASGTAHRKSCPEP